MNSLQNSASRRSNISTSSTSRGKSQNQAKLQDPITMIINATTPSLCTSLILMVTGHQRTGRRTSDHLRRKETQGPSIKDLPNTAKEAELQIVVVAEAHTQSSLCTICTMTMKPIIAPKTAPSFWSQRKKWGKNLQNLRSNQHLEKLTIPCNGPLTTSNILHHILRSFHHKLTKIAKANLRHTINPTIMPQPIPHSLCQDHK
jgi:hypothetical protein